MSFFNEITSKLSRTWPKKHGLMLPPHFICKFKKIFSTTYISPQFDRKLKKYFCILNSFHISKYVVVLNSVDIQVGIGSRYLEIDIKVIRCSAKNIGPQKYYVAVMKNNNS